MNLEQIVEKIRASARFDHQWYLNEYRDVSSLGMDPVVHYLWLGRRLGRKPAPDAESGMDLLAALGLKLDEPVSGASAFVRAPDSRSIAQAALSENQSFALWPSDNQKIDLAHRLAAASTDPRRFIFDAKWYFLNHRDAREADIDPWSHFLQFGKAERRQPNQFLLPAWYLAKNPDVAAAGVDPVDHYVRFGFSEGRPVGPEFDASFYRMQLEAALPSHQDPLAHYLGQANRDAFLTHPSQIDAAILRDRLGRDLTLERTRIAIGVVAYRHNPHEINALLRSAVAAVQACGDAVSAELLVFDNGNTLSESDLLEGAKLYGNGKNDGFGRSQNALMRIAFDNGAQHYIGANPDGAFHPDCVLNLLKMAQRHAGKALIEAVQFPEEHPKFYHPMNLDTAWCSGACFLMSKEVWKKTQGFDSNFFLYCEDVDLSWMVKYKGFDTLTCPSALFYHDVSGRDYSPFIWKEMLIAGRYLGRKWNSPDFVSFAEQRLIADGFVKSLSELPELEAIEPIKDSHGIADFSHMFSFSTTRW